MTSPLNPGWGPRNQHSLLEILIDPTVRTGSGTPVEVRVVVTNTSDSVWAVQLTAHGVDAAWLPRGLDLGFVAPHGHVSTHVRLTPPIGTMPARYPIAIAAQATDPVTGAPIASPTIANTTLIVDAPDQVEVTLEPAELRAVVSRRFRAVLYNRGTSSAEVFLEAHVPSSLSVRLAREHVLVAPGERLRIRGRAQLAQSRSFGSRERHVFTVSARTTGAPSHATGSLTGRALLGPSGSKMLILATIVAVWVAAGLIFIPKLAERTKNQTRAESTSQGTGKNGSGNGGSGSGKGGSGNGNGSESGQGSGSGKGGSGGSGSGSGSGSGGSGSGKGGTSGAGGTPNTTQGTHKPTQVQLNGTVKALDPDQVRVQIEPTTILDAEAVQARTLGTPVELSPEIGKVYSASLVQQAPNAISTTTSVIVKKDGAWSFPAMKTPGLYLLTFTKPGYQTERYIVDSSTVSSTQPLEVTMVAGAGSLSGVVRGPSGAVGGATVTITDGVNTLTTSTNTITNATGVIGQWSIGGLSTPSTYLVSVSKPGLGTESQLVSLAAKGTATVDLLMHAGVAAITGVVSQRTADARPTPPLGGATVTATDGKITRSTTTVTKGPTGQYTLPGLPVPGTYTVTITAPGYLAQTQKVSLRAGQSSARVGAVLDEAGATVTGVVLGDVLDENGEKELGAKPEPKVNAGLILSSATATYKITTSNTGTYVLHGVDPGTYSLTAEYPGLSTGYRTITTTSTHSVTANFTLSVPPPEANHATIGGFVGGATDPSNRLQCTVVPADACIITFTLADSANHNIDVDTGTLDRARPNTLPAATTGPTAYSLKPLSGDFTPGVYRLTASAPGFLPATVTVQVPLNGPGSAPQMNLFPTNTLRGTMGALDSLATDGPTTAAGPPYTNCVYLAPIGTLSVFPTTCDPNAIPGSQCETTGRAGPAYAEIDANNKYELTSLCDATYTMHIVITNPDYIAPPDVSQTLANGQALEYSPHVFRKGRVILTVYSDQDGNVDPVPDGTTVTASCTGSKGDSDALTGAKVTDSQITVTGQPTGTVTCFVSSTIGGAAYSGSTTNIPTANDSDTVRTVTLAQRVGPFWGQVTSPYVSPGSTANTAPNGNTEVASASITINAVTNYNGTLPTRTSVNPPTDTHGCFGVRTTAADLTATPPECSGAVDPNSVALLDAKSTAMTVTVADVPGYRHLDPINLKVAAGRLPAITLTPNPVPVTPVVAISTASGAAPARSDVALHVTSQTGAFGAGTIRVSVNPDGTLNWTDTNYAGATGAWPGEYAITASLDGYQTVDANLTCTFNSTCVLHAGQSLQLNQLASVTGTVGGTLGPMMQVLSGAAVTLTSCTPDSTTAPTTCTNAATPRIYSATTGLDGKYRVTSASTSSPYVVVPDWYNVSVSQPGFDSSTAFVHVVSGANTVDRTLNVTRTNIEIDVSLPSGDPASDATVTLYRFDTGETFAATTSASEPGVFRVTDLVPTSYYVIIGGANLQTTVTVISVPYRTTNQDPPAYKFVAGVVQNTVLGTVLGLQKTATVPSGLDGVTVELGSGTATSFVVAKGADNLDLSTTTAPSGGNSGTYLFSDVKDGAYAMRLSRSGYSTMIAPFTVSVSAGQIVPEPSVTMTRVSQNVTFSLVGSTGQGVDLSTTTLTLAPVTAGDNATYTFTAPAAVTDQFATSFTGVAYGDYTLTLTLPAANFGVVAAATGNEVPITAGDCTIAANPGLATRQTCVVSVTVPPDDVTNPIDIKYTLTEFALDTSVSLQAALVGPSTFDNAPTVQVVVAIGSTVYFKDPDFATFNAGDPKVLTRVWLNPTPGGANTYTVTASGVGANANTAKWPDVTASATGAGAITGVGVDLLFNELAALTVNVTDGATPPVAVDATLTLTPPSGQTVPQAYAGGVTTTGGTYAFTLPVGTWTVNAHIQQGNKNDSKSIVLADLTGQTLTLSPH